MKLRRRRRSKKPPPSAAVKRISRSFSVSSPLANRCIDDRDVMGGANQIHPTRGLQILVARVSKRNYTALQYTKLLHQYSEPDAEDYFFRLLRMPAALFSTPLMLCSDRNLIGCISGSALSCE